MIRRFILNMVPYHNICMREVSMVLQGIPRVTMSRRVEPFNLLGDTMIANHEPTVH